jgi:Holliday junction resolvase RusA-like endonuclease
MLPLEFVIPQRPVSQQARRQARLREWKEFVAEHARSAIDESRALASNPVALRLLYFYDEAALDIDNILKPIQDALIGIVLEDDSVVTDVEIRRRWRRTSFTISAVLPILAAGLALGREFVYFALERGPGQQDLIVGVSSATKQPAGPSGGACLGL